MRNTWQKEKTCLQSQPECPRPNPTVTELIADMKKEMATLIAAAMAAAAFTNGGTTGGDGGIGGGGSNGSGR